MFSLSAYWWLLALNLILGWVDVGPRFSHGFEFENTAKLRFKQLKASSKVGCFYLFKFKTEAVGRSRSAHCFN